MMQWIKMLGLAFAAIVVGAVISEIPPFPGWFEIVDANQTPWLVATGSAAVLGFAMMMGGILDLIMAQDRTLSHEEAEDVERSVRMAAQPVADDQQFSARRPMTSLSTSCGDVREQ